MSQSVSGTRVYDLEAAQKRKDVFTKLRKISRGEPREVIAPALAGNDCRLEESGGASSDAPLSIHAP
tara:strand:+ start:842 stop:1042 length:201 start_codon:yes stop_codon:yes gene_type:complete